MSGMTQQYEVLGMTCGHCVASVREEVGELDGVDSVDVELNAGGTSMVTVASASTLERDHVRAAIEEAGYALVNSAT